MIEERKDIKMGVCLAWLKGMKESNAVASHI